MENRFGRNIIASVILFAAFQLFFYGCGVFEEQAEAPELIQVLTIESGQAVRIPIDEIFYARAYHPAFSQHDQIKVAYDNHKQELYLQPASDFEGFTLIHFRQKGEEMVLPVEVRKKRNIRFECTLTEPADSVFVMGNFNNWNRTADRMRDPQGDGSFAAVLPLEDGIYQYQFVIYQNGSRREIFDSRNPEKVDNGFGYFNSLLRVKSAAKNQAPKLYLLPYQNDHYLRAAIDLSQGEKIDKVIVLYDNQRYADVNTSIEGDRVKVDICPLANEDGVHVIRMLAMHGNYRGNVVTVWLDDGQPVRENPTFIWQDATIYSLMIDRFYNGDPTNDDPVRHPNLSRQANFEGGDFAGLRQKIEEGYFERLGVNTLWISPVNETTDKAFEEWPEPHRWFSGYHGYWPIHHKRTEPRFGSLEEFKTLVQVAHEHGLRVLLDFVSNHTHSEHVFYQKHPDWFGTFALPDGTQNIRRWDEYRLTTWFDTFLPSFDYQKSDRAIRAMTNNAIWWLRATDLDGFRHDATKHIPYKFWKELTRKIKTRVNPMQSPDVYQIGETFGGYDLIHSYVNHGMLDAQFSFNQYFTAQRVFAEKSGDFRDLLFAIEKAQEVYGYHHVMGNLMDSHDQLRMMAVFDGDLTLSDDATERAWQQPPVRVDNPEAYRKAQVYLTYMCSVPGVPVIYYGDEFGMTGTKDPDNRRMMRFSSALNAYEREHLSKTARLLRVRENYSALRRGDFLPIYADQDVLIYSRGDCFHRMIIALNKGAEPFQASIPLPDWIAADYAVAMLEGESAQIENGQLQIQLPGFGAEIFRLE